MRKDVSILFCLFLIAFASPALPQAKQPPKEQAKDVNITGVWVLAMQTPNGATPNDAAFTQEKEALKVAMSGPQGMPMNGTGTVKGGVVQWSAPVNGPNGALTIAYTGKIDGEKMSGDAQVGDFGSFPWSAMRKKT